MPVFFAFLLAVLCISHGAKLYPGAFCARRSVFSDIFWQVSKIFLAMKSPSLKLRPKDILYTGGKNAWYSQNWILPALKHAGVSCNQHRLELFEHQH